MKRALKKFGGINIVLQVAAIAIICGVILIMYKQKDGFQGSSSNYAAVGIQFNGSLSAIYNTFTNTDPTKGPVVETASTSNSMFPFKYPSYMTSLMASPESVLSSFITTYPAFKYCIIQVSTGNVIYDPISEYASKGTMSPFPNTTNVDDYIIYSNLWNMPITKAKATQSQLYKGTGTPEFSNCSSQSARTATEQIVKDVRASAYPSNSAAILSATNNTAANSLLQVLLMKALGDASTSNMNTALYIIGPNPPLYSSTLINGVKTAAFSAVSSTGYTDTNVLSVMTATQSGLAHTAILTYLSTSSDTVAVDAMLQYNAFIPMLNAVKNVANIADASAGYVGFINNITYKSTVYEPCVPFTQGFTNYEGFATSINLNQLYDFNGNKIITSAAPPAPPAAAATPAPPAAATPAPPAAAAKPAETSSNTALYIVAGVATVAVVGGAAVMMANRS